VLNVIPMILTEDDWEAMLGYVYVPDRYTRLKIDKLNAYKYKPLDGTVTQPTFSNEVEWFPQTL
jgi:hypothetical protein